MIDYKKELENSAKTMILVHNPDTLTKLIVRTMVGKVGVVHAGILLHRKDKDTYVLTVSRGEKGFKIPAGFARIDKDSALIKIFSDRKNKDIFGREVVTLRDIDKKLRENKVNKNTLALLEKAKYQLDIFDTIAAIPSYYQNDLLGILLLGRKKSGGDFAKDELAFIVALASNVAMAIRNAQLFDELQHELDKKHKLFIHTTVALAAAIDAKDHYTHGHTSRVTGLSIAIAEEMSFLKKNKINNKFLENLHIASLLHDIGKIGVPESILNKEGPLDAVERKRIEEHTLIGVNILQPIKELEEALAGVKYHHERYDGSGYPEGLKGEGIPLIAAIISVADSFDAMTTDRPYRKALSRETAFEELRSQSGRQFNPRVVEAFFQAYQKGKV
ncbi:MAG: HD-GYP domain-containing protein [Candidatus Omnitrophica bacterium]|nr:HD-GYP domain-containing protein [Candidatus Omnitrophota bacterium]